MQKSKLVGKGKLQILLVNYDSYSLIELKSQSDKRQSNMKWNNFSKLHCHNYKIWKESQKIIQYRCL